MGNLKALYERERGRLAGLGVQGDLKHPVFGEGNIPAAVLFIGEAPGGEEARLSRPFVGRAGKQLDEMLSAAGINRSETFVTNTVKYRPIKTSRDRPSNRTPGPKEIADALPLLKNELAFIRPRVIVTLGNIPLKAVCMLSGVEPITVGAAHGTVREIKIEKEKILLFPLYHPASAIYNRALTTVQQEDIMKLKVLITERK